MSEGKIATILAFAKKNGFVKTSSFNTHLKELGVSGKDRRGILDALADCGYLERTKPSGVVYLWKIAPAGEDFLKRTEVKA